MKRIVSLLIAAAFIIFSGNIGAFAETIYPAGYSISSNYDMSANTVQIDDTLIITRTIVNNESYSLEGLYLSENIPAGLEIASHNVTLNGSAVDYLFVDSVSGLVIPGYRSYYWIVDDQSSAPDNLLGPGDELVLEIRILSDNTGIYALPLHSATFYGNGQGFFTTGDSNSVEFVLSLDAGDDREMILPENRLVSTARPNPFNSTVAIEYSGRNIRKKELVLEIFDILGREIYNLNTIAGGFNGVIYWKTAHDLGSGIYFYRLSCGQESTNGKLLYLK